MESRGAALRRSITIRQDGGKYHALDKFDHFRTAMTCWRLSAAALLVLACFFVTCSYVMARFQHRAQTAESTAAEAWLEGGMPRWKLSPNMHFNETAQFFIDISHSAEHLRDSISSRRARLLEGKGWNGICSVPFPGDLGDRKCKLLVLPVGGADREEVTVPDCSQTSALGVTELFRQLMFQTPAMCPEVTLPAVGIKTLLDRVNAPATIDFMSVQTGGEEDVSILSLFPFSSHCVRAWTIRHDGTKWKMDAIRTTLEVRHGCRVKDGGGEYFARCPCKDGAEVPRDRGGRSDKPKKDQISQPTVTNSTTATKGGHSNFLQVESKKVRRAIEN